MKFSLQEELDTIQGHARDIVDATADLPGGTLSACTKSARAILSAAERLQPQTEEEALYGVRLDRPEKDRNGVSRSGPELRSVCHTSIEKDRSKDDIRVKRVLKASSEARSRTAQARQKARRGRRTKR